MMDRAEFWRIIDEVRGSTSKVTDMPDRLKEFLKQKPLRDILDFEEHYLALFVQANDARLSEAAALAMDGCGDDTFMDFRYWLIAQGRSVYEKVLENPDILADLDLTGGDHGLPLLFYFGGIGAKAYREKAGLGDLDALPVDYSICHTPNLKLLNREFLNCATSKLSQEFPKLYAKSEDRLKLILANPVFPPLIN
jgi:hypothetical protein